jgi:hypothetical protein
MAFGITKMDLLIWKEDIQRGKIAFLTHFWYDERFPHYHSVTKVGCNDREKLLKWADQYGIKKEWIDEREKGFSHFDLMGPIQYEILLKEGLFDHIKNFRLKKI